MSTNNTTKSNFKSFVAGGTLALLTVAGLATAATYASSEDVQDNVNNFFKAENSQGQRGQKAQVHKEERKTALENNDYEAFKTAAEGTPLADQITEENFSKFVEMHNLIEAGDKEGA